MSKCFVIITFVLYKNCIKRQKGVLIKLGLYITMATTVVSVLGCILATAMIKTLKHYDVDEEIPQFVNKLTNFQDKEKPRQDAAKRFLTSDELNFYNFLKSHTSNKAIVFSKVPVKNLINGKPNKRISNTLVDFVLIHPLTAQILCAVDLYYNEEDLFAKASHYKKPIFKLAQIPLYYIQIKPSYTSADIYPIIKAIQDAKLKSVVLDKKIEIVQTAAK